MNTYPQNEETAMNNNQYFIAKDYLRAFELKNLFHKYVVIYSQLYYPDGETQLSNKDRYELTLKLDESMNEITLLAMKMKESKQSTEVISKTVVTGINAAKQMNEHRMAN